MTELDAAAGFRRDHRCQTDGCPNDFAVITVRVDDSEVTQLCDSCQLLFNLAILQQLAEAGKLVLPAMPATPVDAQAKPV